MDDKEIALQLTLKAMDLRLLNTKEVNTSSDPKDVERNAKVITDAYKSILKGLQ